MPQFNYDFNKVIRSLGPSDGELERARISRLIDLAKLEQLRREPGFQERQLALQEGSAETNKTLGFAQLSLEQKKAQVAQFLAENNVKHDAGALAETGRHNVATEGLGRDQLNTGKMTQVIGDLSRMNVDPDTRTKLLADYMAENGDPSLQNVLARTTAATPQKKGEYGPESETATTALVSPVTDALSAPNPGYDPELGKNLLESVTNIPLALSNMGSQMYNYGIAAPSNLINSIVGLPPLQRATWADSYADALGYKKPVSTSSASILTAKTPTGPTPTPTPAANYYTGPPGYPDTTSAKKKARMRRASSEFAY